MSRSRSSQVKADPNLTPLLDMVFQLITFFMLVTNFKARELDLKLKLPVLGSVRPVAGGRLEKVLVFNVRSVEGKPALSLYGRLLTGEQIKSHIAAEAEASRLAAKLTMEDIFQGDKKLPDTVVIRAGRECPFGNINDIITWCQEQGYRRFALRSWSQDRTVPGEAAPGPAQAGGA
jgi:biopolymer transport protein ExbD